MNLQPKHSSRSAIRRAEGFTLVELMIAMLLGLVVIGGVVSVFIAGQRSYTTNKAIGDVQDSTRIAFELMARDIRDAGLIGCNNNGRVANVLVNPTAQWYTDWNNAVHGYGPAQVDPAVAFGTSAGDRSSAANSDSLQILGAGDLGLTVNQRVNAANFKINETTSDLHDNDIIVVCDPDHSAILQVTNYQSTNKTVVHNSGNGSGSIGNCSKGLGFPTVCTSNGNAYEYGPNSQIALLKAHDWYIGVNSVNGTSLYQVSISNDGTTITTPKQEMVRGVTAMTMQYHMKNGTSFVPATSVTDWSAVDAVRVTLTMESSDKRAGINTQPISRLFTATTTIRNRVQ